MTDKGHDDVLSKEEGAWVGETVGERSDGTRFVEDHYLATTDDGGVVCIVREVTRRRRLERASEENHDRIAGASIELGPEQRVTDATDGAIELIVPDGSDLVGRPFREALPDDASIFEANFRTAIETGEPVSFEAYVPSLDRRLAVDVSPSETGLSVSFRDATETFDYRRRSEEREATLRDIYTVIADGDRSFEEKVDALLNICQDVIGTEYATLSRVRADEYHFEVVRAPDESVAQGDIVPLSATNCERAVETGETLVLEDVSAVPELADRAGNAEWGIACYLGAPVIVHGNVYGTFCFYDTIPRADAFTDWEVTLVDLLSRWVGHELEREKDRRRLEESNERLEQFAYAASHDLQEPLRMISSYLQLIDRRYADDLDSDGREFLEFAVDGADRMREMIDGLLEYSRVETQGRPLEPVALDDVLEDALANLEVKIDENDAEITTDELPRVTGDRRQLRQVFQNLIANAIEYDDGTPHVHVSARRDGTDCIISVRDDGIGIDPDDTERIFTVFQRLHAVDEHPGTGIGLALCQRIVERHGGRIWVESEPGEGSTFSFVLPSA